MKVPKIEFTYSSIYDKVWENFIRISSKRKGYFYPPRRVILKYMQRVGRRWYQDDFGSQILVYMSRITKLKWSDNKIHCYLVGNCQPFSDPVTIPLYYKKPNHFDIERFINVLIHELIHQLLNQEDNPSRTKNAWKYFYKRYRGESESTKTHILVQAIHQAIYLKFFSEKELKKDIEIAKQFTKKDPVYARAWQIVEKDGYQNIIAEFRKRIK